MILTKEIWQEVLDSSFFYRTFLKGKISHFDFAYFDFTKDYDGTVDENKITFFNSDGSYSNFLCCIRADKDAVELTYFTDSNHLIKIYEEFFSKNYYDCYPKYRDYFRGFRICAGRTSFTIENDNGKSFVNRRRELKFDNRPPTLKEFTTEPYYDY